ncbi:MAG TPA: hypothetical protein DIU15_19960 [Deltaproteobacteria bacterium]|nr:hypothetical protein [Deltaproteobacteria bacterium]HCP48325.1 hypothetical protein [Deltaproteobacteria bacterium]
MFRPLSPTALFVILGLAALCWQPRAEARPGGGPGSPDCSQQSDEERTSISLRKQIAATELVAVLELSPEQKAELAALVSEALENHEQRQERRAQRAAEAVPLLQDYLDDLEADGEASESSVVALRSFAGKQRETRPDSKQKRQEMRGRFRALLSDEQLEALRDFRPMAAVRPDANQSGARADGHASEAPRRDRRARARARSGEYGGKHSKSAGAEHRQHGKRHKLVKVLVSEEMLSVLSR